MKLPQVRQRILRELNTDTLEEKHIYTVSELTQNIKFLLEDTFGYLWVEGEVSNYRIPSSGHIYFTLKDNMSEIRAVMFKNSHQRLRFELEDGLHVLCYAKVSVYEKRGEYQLLVEYIEPRGIGALMLALEQLKKRLEQEGLFDPARKKQLPFLPQRIGIVTSLHGAAIRDILKILRRRFYNLHIIIYPVKVQGDGAALEIAQAIDDFNRIGGIDVLIVGRGGGSIEDLWAFNEEIVARAIARSQIPIISAVGHERDFTISDLVADLRAATPSAGAELVVQRKDILEEKLNVLAERMVKAIKANFAERKERLSLLENRYGIRQFKNTVLEKMQRIDELEERIRAHIVHIFKRNKQSMEYFLRRLEGVNPLAVLGRGYSICFDDKGNVIRDVKQLKLGDVIRTRLAQGSFKAKVEEIEE